MFTTRLARLALDSITETLLVLFPPAPLPLIPNEVCGVRKDSRAVALVSLSSISIGQSRCPQRLTVGIGVVDRPRSFPDSIRALERGPPNRAVNVLALNLATSSTGQLANLAPTLRRGGRSSVRTKPRETRTPSRSSSLSSHASGRAVQMNALGSLPRSMASRLLINVDESFSRIRSTMEAIFPATSRSRSSSKRSCWTSDSSRKNSTLSSFPPRLRRPATPRVVPLETALHYASVPLRSQHLATEVR